MFLGVHYCSEICMVDGTSFVLEILEGDDSQLCYLTTLTKPHQERPVHHSWMLWKRILKTLTPSPKTTTNRLTKRLETWIDAHSEYGKWLSYQDKNRNFYTRETHEDKKWIVYKECKYKAEEGRTVNREILEEQEQKIIDNKKQTTNRKEEEVKEER